MHNKLLVICLIIIILAAGLFIGLKYYNTTKIQQLQQKPATSTTTNLPSNPQNSQRMGFGSYHDPATGLSFSFPKKWGTVTNLNPTANPNSSGLLSFSGNNTIIIDWSNKNDVPWEITNQGATTPQNNAQDAANMSKIITSEQNILHTGSNGQSCEQLLDVGQKGSCKIVNINSTIMLERYLLADGAEGSTHFFVKAYTLYHDNFRFDVMYEINENQILDDLNSLLQDAQNGNFSEPVKTQINDFDSFVNTINLN